MIKPTSTIGFLELPEFFFRDLTHLHTKNTSKESSFMKNKGFNK